MTVYELIGLYDSEEIRTINIDVYDGAGNEYVSWTHVEERMIKCFWIDIERTMHIILEEE